MIITRPGKPGGPPGCATTADGPSHTTSTHWRSSMSPIITQPGRQAHLGPQPDAAARQRRNRLARANVEDMELALAFLSMIDPEAFEIAFTAVAPPAGRPPRTPRRPRTRSRSRCAANAVPSSGSSSPVACSGSTSAVTASRPAPRRSTTRAIAQRSPGFFPARTRESSSQQALGQCPVGQTDGAFVCFRELGDLLRSLAELFVVPERATASAANLPDRVPRATPGPAPC